MIANGHTTNGTTPTLTHALRNAAAGLSQLPIKADGSKKPDGVSWKRFQSERADEQLLRAWFGNGKARGIAIVGGKISGNLECIDIDAPELVAPYLEAVERAAPGLLAKITQNRTPRPALHLVYRCSGIEIPGNHELARTEPQPVVNKSTGEPELDKNGKQKMAPLVLIETRGTGGYFVAPGSPAACHPTGRLYEHVGGPPLHEVQDITGEDREVLFRCARQFNRYVDENESRHDQHRDNQPAGQHGLRPGDDFNVRASWDEILLPHGWRRDCVVAGLVHWTRPGKDSGTSATTGAVSKVGNELLCVFSTNADPFQGANAAKCCTSYSKFAAYALLDHGGDFELATKALAAAGYGEPTIKARKETSNTTEGGDKRLSMRFADNRTERANAKRYMADHGPNTCYCGPWEKFLAFNGRYWEVDDRCIVPAWAKDVAAKLWPEVGEIHRTEDTPETLKQAVVSFAKSTNSANGIRNMLALVKSEPNVPVLPRELDAQPWLFNVENGTLDLRTGKLHPHCREDMLTKLAPVVFDPAAECPLWLGFLERIMAGDRSLISFLQRAVGMSLTGIVRDHCLLFCYGTGANGKGVFLNTIKRLMGDDYALNAPPELLLVKPQGGTHPTEMASLHGKRFVAASEVDDGRRFAEATLKTLTGGDPVTARRCYEDFWTFEPQHHLWVAANHRPGVRGNDFGVWRRIKLIPFAVTIPPEEQDGELPEKLLGELSGILNWALQGCRDWQDYGLHEPDVVKAATAEYRADMDVVGEFLAEKCAIDVRYEISAANLYGAYKEWGDETGEHVMSQRRFGRQLTERGFTKHHSGGTQYRGLTLRNHLKF